MQANTIHMGLRVVCGLEVLPSKFAKPESRLTEKVTHTSTRLETIKSTDMLELLVLLRKHYAAIRITIHNTQNQLCYSRPFQM